eukprot:7087484-Ditylum_brightwellii.AAC.1
MMTTDWADIAREVMIVYPWSWTLFVPFVTVSVYILVNVIAVVVSYEKMALASDMMSCDNGMDARDCHMAVDQKNDSKTMHERGKDAEEALARHAQHYFPASQQTCLTTSETNCCHSTKTIREMQSQIN